MENNATLPSGKDSTDNFDPSSRKRKLIATDVEAKLGNQIPYQLNQQRVPFPWKDVQKHTHQSWLYPNHSLEPTTIKNQFQTDQLHCQNYSLEPRSTSNGYLYHSVISNPPSTLSSQSSKSEDCSSLSQMQARKTPELLNCASDGCSMYSRSGTSTLPFLRRSCNAPIENPQIEMDDLVKYGSKNHGTPKVTSGIGKVSPESSRSVETVAINFTGGFNKRTCSEEESNIESACVLRISHHTGDSTNDGISNLLSELADNSRVSVVESLKQKSSQNVVKSFSASSACGEENSGTEEQGHKEGSIDVMKQKEITKEDIKDSFIEDPIKDGVMLMNRIGHAHSSRQTNGSFNFRDKERSSPAKAASLVHEKLWEGSLQLNSSVTASAVAFYKSGERLLDVNWSECVEVKGKVRLEAFEKYIQDLPRSRTRGLMVTSMCWKKGSAERGLKGMKEVAKAYRKGDRVGFAKLSPSVDIYLCPPSDKIITILAKYGFFSGLAAVEDKSELLLGCIVWRKNQMISGAGEKKSLTSGSVEKKSETSGSGEKKSENNDSLSEQILKIPSDGSSQTVVEGDSSSLSHTLVNCSSALGILNVDENRKIEVSKMSSSIEFLPTASVQTMASISAGEQKSGSSSTSKGFERQLQETKTYWAHPKMEQSKTSSESELHKAVIPFPCTAIKPNMPVGEDDDLPEFDFKTTCEIPLASARRTLQPKGIQISDGLVVQTKNSVSLATPKSSSDEMKKKKLFSDDDDDDMPEWLPPKPQIQSSVEANNPSAMLHTASFNSTSRDRPQRPCGPVSSKLPPGPLTSPHPVPARPYYPSQGFPPVHRQPPNMRVPQPMPFQNGPRPSGFTFISALQPLSGPFESKHPPVPGNIRGWRPS